MEVECRLKRSSQGPRGALRVLASPPDAALWVNGEHFHGETLPIGRHSLRVEHAGYHPWTTVVRIEQAKTAQVAARLTPTREQEDTWRAANENRNAWAIALTVTGAVLATVGGATYAWNSGQYSNWRRDRRALDAEFARGQVTTEMLEENASLDITGGITLGVSGAFWFGVGAEPVASRGTTP
jgi:hypothetical protein